VLSLHYFFLPRRCCHPRSSPGRNPPERLRSKLVFDTVFHAYSRSTRLLLLLIVPKARPDLDSRCELDLGPRSDQVDLSTLDIVDLSPSRTVINRPRLSDLASRGVDGGYDADSRSVEGFDDRRFLSVTVDVVERELFGRDLPSHCIIHVNQPPPRST
jgi:hypothetical protein